MVKPLQPKIICADSLDDGVVVTFEDGRTVLYSAQLLSETASEATDITALADDELL